MFFHASSTGRHARADIAIDFGTARTTVLMASGDVAFDEPSLTCFRGFDAVPAFVAAGAEAERYVGRVAKPLKIVAPLREGVISDMDAARELLRYATREVRPRRRFGRTRALIGAPADATPAEKRSLAAAAMDAGISHPEIVPEPLLAAAGAGIELEAPRGAMVVDCGAGVVEAVVVSLGGACASGSVRGGGAGLTRALIDHLRIRHHFRIGFASAERLKLDVSRRLAADEIEAQVSVSGLESARGLPRTIELPVAELAHVWERDLAAITEMVREVLGRTPPELSQDVLEEGLLLTGGAAETALLARRIEEGTGVPTRVADNARGAVAEGLRMRMGERV
ncbi:rod shape-determining protein [Sphingosinicella terrae]|uniref:rod shape-determining protein n=1 Tax=Sphingosinicella terrae TaxID=2172047 RepID=UPI000E0D930B|nr:rod shape-determining protein [Sphingosinicella terrae]